MMYKINEPDGNSFKYQFAIKDHLGSNRVVFKERVDGLKIVQQTHNYVFGGTMEGSWNAITTSEQDYKFGGKELNEEYGLGLYDHGARWRDPFSPQG